VTLVSRPRLRPQPRETAVRPRKAVARASRTPRYLEVAETLTRAIADGTYPVGSTLPSEMELCGHFAVSRFTARAALGTLQRQGYLSRRPRIGSVVVASNPAAKYSVLAHNTVDLLRFSGSTDIHPVKVEDVKADTALAAELGCEPGEPWIKVSTYRTSPESGLAVSWTVFYLRPEHRGIIPRIGKKRSPVHDLIEETTRRPVSRVEQRIEACVLPRAIALVLGVPARSAALRAVHRLFTKGAEDRFYAAISLYPAGRFHLAQTLTREH
jgi:GntR family transcriptional regulator